MNKRRMFQSGLGIICLALVAFLSSAIRPSPAFARPANDYVSGCTGQYFNNTTLSGSPVLVRTDSSVNFFWPEGTSPGPGVNVSQYSVSWTCSINVATAGTYAFTLVADDGMNLLIDGNLILWAWYDEGPSTYAKAVYLNAGTHTVLVQYYNDTLGGTAQVYSNITGGYYVPPPPPGPAPVTSGYLTNCTGEYFNNISLAGSPAFVRIDPALNFNWPNGTSPGAGLGVNNYSVRWTCQVNAATAGAYSFTGVTDDGMNVWVDGNLVIGAWHDQYPTSYSNTMFLNAGTHTVLVQYYDHAGAGTAQVSSSVTGGSAYYPSSPTTNYSGGFISSCTGEYFNNTTLAGSPVVVRTDPGINFYWPEWTSPVAGVNVNQYSVRWTCSINVATDGTYSLTLLTDDGMNVLIDGNLILWAWYDQGPSAYAKAVFLNAGAHTVVVQYYNDTLGGTAQVSLH